MPMPRVDYFTADYSIEERDSKTLRFIRATGGKFTGPGFGNTEPAPCASTSTYFSTRIYDFSYEDEDRKHMTLGYTEPGRTNILKLRKVE